MRTKLLPAAIIVLVASILHASMVNADDGPTVTVTPPPTPTTTTFDPTHPPSDLHRGEAADTTSEVGVQGGPYGESFDGNKTVTIKNVGQVTTDISNTIRLPTDANDPLKQHEQGHADLNSFDYTAKAQQKVQDAYRGFVGMTFTGAGTTPEERQADALKQADAERDRRNDAAAKGIQSQLDTLGKKYDDLTTHGTSNTVNTAQGQDMAKKELKLASAAGQSSFRPGSGPGVAGTADPPSVSYHPTSSLLSFSSGRVDFSGSGMTDSLLGASITVSSMVSIGLQSNGTIHLGDAELNIQKNGQLLLHGYLIEAAYMSSSVPGFAAMIQASLDIPPDFTGTGINNSVGSPVLATLKDYIGTGDRLPMFWFYINQPLFDANGQSATLSSEGVMKFGIPVAEPSTATLVLVGLMLLCSVTWRHRRTFKS